MPRTLTVCHYSSARDVNFGSSRCLRARVERGDAMEHHSSPQSFINFRPQSGIHFADTARRVRRLHVATLKQYPPPFVGPLLSRILDRVAS